MQGKLKPETCIRNDDTHTSGFPERSNEGSGVFIHQLSGSIG